MKNEVGKWAEEIICHWLTNQGYFLLHFRWHCRYGEIDIIAQNVSTSTIMFVEVKTRGNNNWDNNGRNAIDYKKQTKLRLAGESFLSEYPAFSVWNCRFDVALLHHHRQIKTTSSILIDKLKIPSGLNQTINYQGYQFKIIDYIENAF